VGSFLSFREFSLGWLFFRLAGFLHCRLIALESLAHRSGVGVCLPGRGGDKPILWRDGGVTGRVRLVPEELTRPRDAAARRSEAERPGVIRHVRQRLRVVSGRRQRLFLWVSRRSRSG